MVFENLKLKLLEAKFKKAKTKAQIGSLIIDKRLEKLSKEETLRNKILLERKTLEKKKLELKAKISEVRNNPIQKKKLERDLANVKTKLKDLNVVIKKIGNVTLKGLKLLHKGLSAVSEHMDEVERKKKKTTKPKKKKTTKPKKKKTTKPKKKKTTKPKKKTTKPKKKKK